MTTIKFTPDLCKHKGWKGRYSLIYNTDDKTARCTHCGKTYKYEEVEE